MNLDFISIILRFGVLLVLAVVSQLAFHRKQYSLSLWTFAFWLTIFRLLAVRVLTVYAHKEDGLVEQLQMTIMRGWPATLSDILLIASAIPMYFWIKKTYKQWLKEVDKNGIKS